jgi:hypothetical protein
MSQMMINVSIFKLIDNLTHWSQVVIYNPKKDRQYQLIPLLADNLTEYD